MGFCLVTGSDPDVVPLLSWLVFAQPFFQGVPRILEVGGYSNPAAWGVEQPYVGSVHPLKVVSTPAEARPCAADGDNLSSVL